MNQLLLICIVLALANAYIIRLPPGIQQGHVYLNGNMTLFASGASESFQLGGQAYYDFHPHERVFLNMSMTDWGENMVLNAWMRYSESTTQSHTSKIQEVLLLTGYRHEPYKFCQHLVFEQFEFYNDCADWVNYTIRQGSVMVWDQVCNSTDNHDDDTFFNGNIIFSVHTKVTDPTIPTFIQTRTVSQKRNAFSNFDLTVLSVHDDDPESVWVPPKTC